MCNSNTCANFDKLYDTIIICQQEGHPGHPTVNVLQHKVQQVEKEVTII